MLCPLHSYYFTTTRNTMHKTLLTALLLFLFSIPSAAQWRIDWGFKAGGANYLGEMGGKEESRRDFVYDMKLSQTRWAAGAFFRYRITSKLAFNTGLNYGRIQGADALSLNPGRVGRNLSFRNDIFELYARADYYLYSSYDIGPRRGRRWDYHTYFFAGVATVYHNPQAQLDGEWVNLRPLRTEGQLAPYSPITFALPKGIGMYFTYKRKYKIGWELGWRTTFTDYLDDVSTTYADEDLLDSPEAVALANRNDELDYENSNVYLPASNNYTAGNKRGDPTNNDSYLFTNVTFSWVMRGKSRYIRLHPGLKKKVPKGRRPRWKRFWIEL